MLAGRNRAFGFERIALEHGKVAPAAQMRGIVTGNLSQLLQRRRAVELLRLQHRPIDRGIDQPRFELQRAIIGLHRLVGAPRIIQRTGIFGP